MNVINEILFNIDLTHHPTRLDQVHSKLCRLFFYLSLFREEKGIGKKTIESTGFREQRK